MIQQYSLNKHYLYPIYIRTKQSLIFFCFGVVTVMFTIIFSLFFKIVIKNVLEISSSLANIEIFPIYLTNDVIFFHNGNNVFF